ncbi:MFS transporter [Natrarchaeobius sp. A-rgal3]|uniref:MFS transporter n=1 Tax=Natrarchaeobius versutus TaxID=1679078 RepID=UPI00350E9D6D
MNGAAPGEETDENLASGHSGRILLAVTLGTLCGQLGYLVLPPLLPEIVATLSISETQAGIGLSVLALLTAAFRYPGGRIADDLSRNTAIVLGVLALIVGYSFLATSTRYTTFLLGVSFVGIGLGVYVPAGFAQLSDVFDRKRGRAFGLNDAAVSLAGVFASGFAAVAVAIATWRYAFAPILIGLVSVVVLYDYWSKGTYVLERPSLEVRPTLRRIAGTPGLRSMILLAGLFMFVWNGTISFLPIVLETVQGLSRAESTVAYAGVFAVGVLATPFSGYCGDRAGAFPVVVAAIMSTIAGLATLLLAASTAGVVIGVVLLAAGLTGFWPPMSSALVAAFPDENTGGDYGIVGTVYMAFGSLGPTYVGVVSGRSGYTVAYGGFLFVLGACAIVASWLALRR